MISVEDYPKVLRQLQEGEQVSLASWLATPVSREQATTGLDKVQQRLISRTGSGENQFPVRLAELILRYWAGQVVEAAHENLFALLPDGKERAMLELAVGQLLMARRTASAWKHLDRGFVLATHLFEPEAYFVVLRRHELLRHLPLSARPLRAATLEALLDEAQVIARLKGRGRRMSQSGPEHQDTLD